MRIARKLLRRCEMAVRRLEVRFIRRRYGC